MEMARAVAAYNQNNVKGSFSMDTKVAIWQWFSNFGMFHAFDAHLKKDDKCRGLPHILILSFIFMKALTTEIQSSNFWDTYRLHNGKCVAKAKGIYAILKISTK